MSIRLSCSEINVNMRALVILVACLLCLAAAASSDKQDIAKKFLRKLRHRRCSADITLNPSIGMMVEAANDHTSEMARSHYNNFPLRFVRSTNSSTIQMALEYKTPELHIAGKQVNIKWNNILLTAKISVARSDCSTYANSILGFVELVKTDVVSYKYYNNGTKYREETLANNNDLQYVITKPSPNSRYIFADNSLESVARIPPQTYAYLVPLKYESSENTVIDFERYPNTQEYERLIEKKIFLVHITPHNEIKRIAAGIDVMMYLNYNIHGFTNAPQVTLNRNHSVIQRIVNPEKYASVISRASRHYRNKELRFQEAFVNAQMVTLDPLPKNIHVYTS